MLEDSNIEDQVDARNLTLTRDKLEN